MNLVRMKGKGKNLVFYLEDSSEFEKVLEELDRRLKQSIFDCDLEIGACFNFGARNLTDDQLADFFDLVLRGNKVYIEEVLMNTEVKKTEIAETIPAIEVADGIIRNGEIRYFESSVVFIGTVNAGGLLKARNEVFLLGEVYGEVAVENVEGKIVGQYFSDATLRVGKKVMHNVTTFATLVIYDDSDTVEMSKRSEQQCLELSL